MTTAAKMVLHDWQRGKIPFFVPPPKQEIESSTEPDLDSIDGDVVAESSKTSAAFKAIANVISSQQQMSVPVQRDLYSETELKGETAEQLQTSNDEKSEEEADPSESDDEISEEES